MLYRFHAILDWGKAHQGKVVLGGTALYGLLRLIDTISTWLGRREAASILFNDLWDTAVVLGVWTIFPVVGLIVLYAQWPVIKRRISGPAFEVRPICGDTLGIPIEREVFGRLAIKNISGHPLAGVSVKIVRVYKIHETGFLWGRFTSEYPSIHPDRGETFVLRWSSKESASSDRKYLDIPNDGADRIADCLILNRVDPNCIATFAAANPDDLKDCLRGVGGKNWWKLDVLVAAASGTSEEVEVIAGVGSDPGPISLLLWHPHGERIIEQLNNQYIEAQDARRKQHAQLEADAKKKTPPTTQG